MNDDVRPGTAAYAVQRAVRALDHRQQRILAERSFAAKPRTLQALGTDMDLTRERIRQLEEQALALLRAHVQSDPACQRMVADVRSRTRPAASLERLGAEIDGFATRAFPLQVTTGMVLIALDATTAVEGRWVSTADLPPWEHTRQALDRVVDAHGAAPMAAVAGQLDGMPMDDLTDWLVQGGMVIVSGHVLTRVANAVDQAAGVLSITGEPLPVEDIAALLPRKMSVRSLRARLMDDPRFVRSGVRSMSLAEWGASEYTSISDQIARAIDAAGGEVPLAALIEDLHRRFGVATSSVELHARNGHQFRVVHGKVTYANPITPAGVERVRRMYRRADAWVYRFTVNGEHTRGSGSPLPLAMAPVLGLDHGGRVSRPSPDREQLFSWVSLQLQVGSVRSAVQRLGLAEGDQGFMVLFDDGTFDVEPVAGTSALDLVGADSTDDGDVWQVMAAALDLDTADLVEVVRRLVLDGDGDVVAALPTDDLDLCTRPCSWTPRANEMLRTGMTVPQTARALGLADAQVHYRFAPTAMSDAGAGELAA